MQIPEVPFSYKNDRLPEFGNAKVESTSIYVCAIPTWPIILVFGWIEKLPYIKFVDPSGVDWPASRLNL